MALALEGIRVLDFTQIIAGPLATRQLAMLGAEVIKVETPGLGDIMRSIMAGEAHATRGFSPMFQYLNTGKRSLTLDLKDARIRQIALQLAAKADVIVENFRPGVMKRLGLDAEAVRAINPSAVYCSISGYGQAGPKIGLAAYDGPLQADSGLMSVNGAADGPPTRLGVMAIDTLVGANAATAILGGLMRQRASGEGQALDLSLFDTALHMLAPQIHEYANQGHRPARTGNMTAAGLPTDNLFETADEPILITAINDRQVVDLFELIGASQLNDDRRANSTPARLANARFIEQRMMAALAGDTAANWEKKLRAAGIPCARVRSIPEVLDDEQSRFNGVLEAALAPPDYDGPDAIVMGAGYRADRDGPRIAPAPLLGADTNEILQELGLDAIEIARLSSDGAI